MPEAGTCRSCGRALVHVPYERTYHPASALGPDDFCAALLPIFGTTELSFEVSPSEFIPSDRRPCRGVNSNTCVAEGCYGEACIGGVA